MHPQDQNSRNQPSDIHQFVIGPVEVTKRAKTPKASVPDNLPARLFTIMPVQSCPWQCYLSLLFTTYHSHVTAIFKRSTTLTTTDLSHQPPMSARYLNTSSFPRSWDILRLINIIILSDKQHSFCKYHSFQSYKFKCLLADDCLLYLSVPRQMLPPFNMTCNNHLQAWETKNGGWLSIRQQQEDRHHLPLYSSWHWTLSLTMQNISGSLSTPRSARNPVSTAWVR